MDEGHESVALDRVVRTATQLEDAVTERDAAIADAVHAGIASVDVAHAAGMPQSEVEAVAEAWSRANDAA